MTMNRTNWVYFAYIACIICWQITITNCGTTLWKLNNGKIQTGYRENEKDDEVFHIITSTIAFGSSWSKQSVEIEKTNIDNTVTVGGVAAAATTATQPCQNLKICDKTNNISTELKESTAAAALQSSALNTKNIKKSNTKETTALNDELDCGKSVNFTYYDYLIGVAQRFNHPIIPEPEVAYLFLKTQDERSIKSFDLNALEKRLKRNKKEKPRSVHLYNQIGNYWRIKGDALQSIECFRRALSITPTNAEVLLNLAGVLFNLQYLDDAIHLTRRSLEVQPPDRSAWRQYLTLGEIFKAYGHFQESLLHLRHALELYPQHEPILKVLREVESLPTSPLHAYTLFIILALVIAVIIVIITSTDSSEIDQIPSEYEPKMHRHFNRAMAMRSLKGFTPRNFKHRKY